jgi:hypothetical protein
LFLDDHRLPMSRHLRRDRRLSIRDAARAVPTII